MSSTLDPQFHRRIVVLTPVKNEAWILERFLAVTSTFADGIVVADQGSTDESVSICRRFPKVRLVENPSREYDEAARQTLLLEAARRLFPGEKILLALDADEIMAADGPGSPGWHRMLGAEPGTVLLFEKPDLYGSPHRCLRHDRPWPLGYVDDGTLHQPRRIHSLRIPHPPGNPRLEVPDVKVLHYGLTRLRAQRAKMRYYAAVENIEGTNHLAGRRRLYSARFDWTATGRLDDSPASWFAGWIARGIDPLTLSEPRFTWHDVEVLRLFGRYGQRRFWLDPVWDQDWEACREHAAGAGEDLPPGPFPRPPAVVRAAGAAIDFLYDGWLRAKRRLRRGSPGKVSP